MHRLYSQLPLRQTRPLASLLRLLCLLSLVICPAISLAQSTFGSFVGSIKDPQGAVVVGATVKLYRIGTASVQTAVTGADGQYTLLNIEAGSYRMVVEFAGFQTLQFTGLTLQ